MSRLISTIALCAVLATALTAVVVTHSLEFGKLAIAPDYDDSHSMVDGGIRYLVWKQDGAAAAWQHYLNDLPHSFLHYYFAAVCFALFGVDAPVVYWASGVFVFGAALGCALLLQSVSLLRAGLLIAAFLCLPVAFNIIHDFRSECGMAALLFAACCAAFRSAWHGRYSVSFAVVSGCLLALSLGIKPAMFIYVLGIAGACSIVWIAAAFIRGKQHLKHSVVCIAVAWVVMVVPFSFHFILNAQQIFGYILTNAFASDFWKQKGTFLDQLAFHYWGFPGVFQLGIFRYPIVLIAVIGLIWTFIFRRPSPLRAYLWSFAFLAMCAYAGVAINSINQNHFSMTFHLLLGASAVLSIALVAESLPRWPGHVVCGAAAALAIFFWDVPVTQNYVERTREVGGDAALEWRREGPRQVFDLVRAGWDKSEPPQAWAGAYGWIDGNTITWEAITDGLPWKVWNYYSRQPESGNLYPDWAEILVIPEPGVMGTIDLPLNTTIPEMNRTAAEDPALQLVGAVADPAGKEIRVYRRVDIPEVGVE